jgi:antitoxin YefM
MNTLNISSDIIPIGEFKTRLSQYLKNLHNTGHPLVITQNGKPAGVLISPAEYDDLVYKKLFIESGNVYSTMEIKAELQKRRAARRST